MEKFGRNPEPFKKRRLERPNVYLSFHRNHPISTGITIDSRSAYARSNQ
jgi:hypothetical protein